MSALSRIFFIPCKWFDEMFLRNSVDPLHNKTVIVEMGYILFIFVINLLWFPANTGKFSIALKGKKQTNSIAFF